MTNAQNVKKCASPGTDHFSSRVCPNTSTSWVRNRRGRSWERSGAGWPDRINE